RASADFLGGIRPAGGEGGKQPVADRLQAHTATTSSAESSTMFCAAPAIAPALSVMVRSRNGCPSVPPVTMLHQIGKAGAPCASAQAAIGPHGGVCGAVPISNIAPPSHLPRMAVG